MAFGIKIIVDSTDSLSLNSTLSHKCANWLRMTIYNFLICECLPLICLGCFFALFFICFSPRWTFLPFVYETNNFFLTFICVLFISQRNPLIKEIKWKIFNFFLLPNNFFVIVLYQCIKQHKECVDSLRRLFELWFFTLHRILQGFKSCRFNLIWLKSIKMHRFQFVFTLSSQNVVHAE